MTDKQYFQPTQYDPLQSTQSMRLTTLMAVMPLSALEMFHPKLVREIQLMWGYPELNTFLDQLAFNTVPDLKPLSGAELSEIVLLTQVHHQIVPPKA